MTLAADAACRVDSPAAMGELGRRLAALLRRGDVVVLTGPLGAGKTTLVQGIGAGLGVQGPVTSPTFVIARIHRPARPAGLALVHADGYRLAGRAELDDLDLDADLDSSVTVMEWGEGLAELLSADYLQITIARPALPGPPEQAGFAGDSAEPRVVAVHGHGPRWQAAAAEVAGVLSGFAGDLSFRSVPPDRSARR